MAETKKLKRVEVLHGRVSGLVYGKPDVKDTMLVVFNQWRSGAKSIFSQYLAEIVLDGQAYSCVLFVDRIASGGMSDEKLTADEKASMRQDGELIFGRIYAEAIEQIIKKYDLPKKYVLAGSSAGAPAVLATAIGLSTGNRKHVLSLVLVEPAGLRTHGIGKRHHGGVVHAFVRHAVAYRHRLGRGWWTPMDKEQYFGKKGKMFEYRARWFAGDPVLRALASVLPDPSMPALRIVLSTTSHVHTPTVREQLKNLAVPPHRILEIKGNHDKICQPPSLSKFYSEAVN